RLSAAYSPMVANNMALQMAGSQPYPTSSYNNSPALMASGGTDQSTAMLSQLDVGPSALADFVSPPGSPAGAQGQYQNHQQWPSGVTDEQVAVRVNGIIATTDLMTITKKQVRQQIMANFGMSVDEEKSRRDFINQCIAQELERHKQRM
ncbi:hypothetical protein GGI22_006374, partial [Coemansia erecta]